MYKWRSRKFYKNWRKYRAKKKTEFLELHGIQGVTDPKVLKGRKVNQPDSEYDDLYECYRGKLALC